MPTQHLHALSLSFFSARHNLESAMSRTASTFVLHDMPPCLLDTFFALGARYTIRQRSPMESHTPSPERGKHLASNMRFAD